jgi:hypothetical protein
MNVLTVISPGLKVLFERVGRPEVINRPDFFRFDVTGAGRKPPFIRPVDPKSYSLRVPTIENAPR